jgi:hypothetical protein
VGLPGINFLVLYKTNNMATRSNNREVNGGERNLNANRTENRSSRPNDLPDSEQDRQKLQGEETTIDLPDVSDIPGQENVSVPPLGEMADTTISSADEEGDEIFEDEEDEIDYKMGTRADVSKNERRALEDDSYMPTRDDDNLRNARMDNVDFQGEPLNEKSFGEERSGKDLDVPGTRADNRNEEIGEEDEENNEYSLGGDNND